MLKLTESAVSDTNKDDCKLSLVGYFVDDGFFSQCL